jgi:16S rRNA (cytosine967-C5)-methyltransferase
MKIPNNLLESIPQALLNIFKEGRPADKVIEYYLKNHKKWGSRDRKFFAENVYTLVRHYRLLWLKAGLPADQYLNREELQLHQMQKILRSFLEQSEKDKDFLQKLSGSGFSFAERNSFPDWLDELGRKELGPEWESIAQALNRQAPVFLRTNTLKTSRQHLKDLLELEGIQTRIRPESETALELTERKNVFVTQAFKQGLFEVQDLSSQQVAPLLNPKSGEKVVDGCAGAGGKTLHLAALMKNKGRIYAFDIYERKLEELRKRSTRAGCDVIETKTIDSNKVIKRLENSADAVLLDVPCSGSGVLNRNPDTKWKLTEDDMKRLHALQREILQQYSRMVKKGGRLVYATCSIFPSENRGQVDAFLQQNPDFELVSSRSFKPDRDPGDGFFMALLNKK